MKVDWKKMRNGLAQSGKAVAQRSKKAAQQIAAAPVPKSLEWVYGFGFKVGIFLILKSFIAARYLELSLQGYAIVLSQLVTATVFIIFGLIMQQEGVMNRPQKLRKVIWGYGVGALLSIIVCTCKVVWNWDFFKQAADSNWFMDAVNSIGKGLGEFFMAVIFWDIDLWTLFGVLLCVLTSVYVWMDDEIDEQMRRSIFVLPFAGAPAQIEEHTKENTNEDRGLLEEAGEENVG